MSKVAMVLLLLAATGAAPSSAAQAPPSPHSASELLALVAGSALPENVVHEINADGLAFRPDSAYRSLLKTAGADPSILNALDSAKVINEARPEEQSGNEVLNHLANAGSLMAGKRYDEAASELKAVLAAGFGRTESGFVLGELLRRQERWYEAADVYNVILQQAPNFPEAHTKLSFIEYELGDPERSLVEAKSSVAANTNNAEGHKNAALALEDMRKFDAGVAEYQEALRLKPDYQVVRYDLGILYSETGPWDNAIAEYKKALILDPNDYGAHNNQGITFGKKGDLDSAIREYREAERLDPSRFDARSNLGSTFMERGLYQEAAVEFRGLEESFPNSAICHNCLGNSLFNTWDFQGAEKEYRRAIELDPSHPMPHVGLGTIREQQKQYDEALVEYRKAGQLDNDSVGEHSGAGKVLLDKKDFSHAAEELKLAEDLIPSSPNMHDRYGRALVATGNTDAAIGEFKESLALDSKQLTVRIELAGVLEKEGDWAGSINEYRKASLADASIDLRNKVVRADAPNPQEEYTTAKARFNNHIASLKAAGNSAEAAKLEASIRGMEAAPSISERWDAAMQAGMQANQIRHFDEAKRDFQKGVDLAEQIQPHDQRLATALDYLGNENIGQDPAAAEAAFERELKVTQEIYGDQSPNMAAPLESLGNNALMQKDYASAEKFYFRAVDLNEKAFGEGNKKVADSLVVATRVYMMQKDYAKAEPYLLRAVNTDESLFGKDSIDLSIPLTTLCYMYDQWKQPAKAEPCYRQLMGIAEKQFGANSPVIASLLTSDVQALRDLGRPAEADAMDKRLASIRAATMTPKTNRCRSRRGWILTESITRGQQEAIRRVRR